MGFFDKFFKRSKEEVSEEIKVEEIKLDNAVSFLESKIRNSKKISNDDYKELLNSHKKLSEAVNRLEKAQTSNDVDQRVKSSIDNLRKNLSNQIKPLIIIESSESYSDFNKLIDNSAKILRIMNSPQMNKAGMIRMIFQKEFDNLGDKIKDLKKDFDKSNLILDKKKENINDYELMINKIDELNDLIKNKNLLDNQLKKLNKELFDINSLINSKNNNLKEMMNSSDYSKALELKNELSDLNNKLRTVSKDFFSKIDSIDKAFKRYDKFVEDKEIKSLLDLMGSESADIFSKGDLFKKVILEIIGRVKTDQITFKRKLKDKTLDVLKELPEEFIKTKREVDELNSKINNLKRNPLIRLISKELDLKKEIRDLEDKKEFINKNIKDKKNEIKDIEGKIEALKSELTDKFSRINAEIKF